MRFRLGEDERLYLTLRSEVYLRLLPHLPQKTLVEVMRNLGKLEAMSYGEGIKQGVVVAHAAWSGDSDGTVDPDTMSAISAHAHFYGDAHTPLVRVEKRLHRDEEPHPWLAATPVEFPPQTLHEAIAAYGPTLDAAPSTEAARLNTEKIAKGLGATSVHRLDSKPAGGPLELLALAEKVRALRAADRDLDNDGFGLPEGTAVEIGPPLDVRQLREDGGEDEELAEQIAEEEAAAFARGEDRAQSPDLLDRIRTQIKLEQQNGWEPKTWPDVVLRLMTSMQIDAAFLDLQLGGDQGRVVLDQCGLNNIFPGGGVMVDAEGKFRGVRS